MKFSLLDHADKEMTKAAHRYEDQQAGLGFRFYDAVGEAFQQAIANPQRWPWHPSRRHPKRARYVRVSGFPYLVAYVHSETKLLVIGVPHLSQDEETWLKRIPENL